MPVNAPAGFMLITDFLPERECKIVTSSVKYYRLFWHLFARVWWTLGDQITGVALTWHQYKQLSAWLWLRMRSEWQMSLSISMDSPYELPVRRNSSGFMGHTFAISRFLKPEGQRWRGFRSSFSSFCFCSGKKQRALAQFKRTCTCTHASSAAVWSSSTGCAASMLL